jgi:choline-sulfatase
MPPNILLIMADQLRADALGPATPALNRLAREGVRFTQAITNSPECIPARFALATGLYPHQTGIWRNGPITLSPEAPTWMRALVQLGYRTSLIGKSHFHESAHATNDLRDGIALMNAYGLMEVDEIAGPRASQHVLSNMTAQWHEAGLMQRYCEDLADRIAHRPTTVRASPLGYDAYYDTYVGRAAVDYLTHVDAGAPWFCWVSFAGPHEPWDTPEPFDTLFDPADMPACIPKPADAAQRKGLLSLLYGTVHEPGLTPAEAALLRANYAGNVALIDQQVGDILGTIRERCMWDNTLILFTSDHGELNGDHGLVYKNNFLSASVDIPLIIRPPAGSHRESDALIELIDIGTTILDYAGGFTPRGASLRPLLEGTATAHRSFVTSEYRHHTMIADARWKVEFGPDGSAVLLFDRQQDPTESHNLADSVVAPGHLRAHWHALLERTGERVKIT